MRDQGQRIGSQRLAKRCHRAHRVVPGAQQDVCSEQLGIDLELGVGIDLVDEFECAIGIAPAGQQPGPGQQHRRQLGRGGHRVIDSLHHRLMAAEIGVGSGERGLEFGVRISAVQTQVRKLVDQRLMFVLSKHRARQLWHDRRRRMAKLAGFLQLDRRRHCVATSEQGLAQQKAHFGVARVVGQPRLELQQSRLAVAFGDVLLGGGDQL